MDDQGYQMNVNREKKRWGRYLAPLSAICVEAERREFSCWMNAICPSVPSGNRCGSFF